MTRFGHKLNYVINTFVKHTPGVCLHLNYVGGDSVTMVFNHTYKMGECLGSDFLGQYLPWAISGAFGDWGPNKKAWQCFFACPQML